MKWTVIGEKDGKIKLVSKDGTNGILPKGSFLTIEENNEEKEPGFILRVDDSKQIEPYSPSPLIVDMDLSGLTADKNCKNEITAYRIKDVTERSDGMVDFIPPQSIARRSTQKEIDLALNMEQDGPRVFVATIHSNQNRVLKDENGNHITANLPKDMFFHQLLVCGKTGSGKTVAMKYLAQYFIEKMKGAVLAINVKDVDFLMMDSPSVTEDREVWLEWRTLGETGRGVENLTMYIPANRNIAQIEKINHRLCKSITLDVGAIQPEALMGLLQGISERGALSLPGIFRYWRETAKKQKSYKFAEFVRYFNSNSDSREFNTLSDRGEEGYEKLHSQTFDNISRSLNSAVDFFDNENAIALTHKEILEYGKMSILDFSGDKGPRFGSILLRDLLKKIVDAKDALASDVPILIIIDEVHLFYGTESTKEALSDLDTICRTGRSKKIGVIFASQNLSDIPTGLSSVINTQIFFKTDAQSLKQTGVRASIEELEGLKKGFAVASIHDLPQLKILKFPLSFCGVVNK